MIGFDRICGVRGNWANGMGLRTHRTRPPRAQSAIECCENVRQTPVTDSDRHSSDSRHAERRDKRGFGVEFPLLELSVCVRACVLTGTENSAICPQTALLHVTHQRRGGGNTPVPVPLSPLLRGMPVGDQQSRIVLATPYFKGGKRVLFA